MTPGDSAPAAVRAPGEQERRGRVLVVSRGYPPDPSPSGSLIRNVVEHLGPLGSVTVVARSPAGARYSADVERDYEVVRLPEPSTTRGLGRRLRDRLRRVVGAPPGRRVRGALLEVLDRLALGPDDVVLPCTPDEIQVVADHRKSHDFTFVPFFLEVLPRAPRVPGAPFVGRWADRRVRKAERRVVERADAAIGLPTVHKILTDDLPELAGRLVRTEHPMLRDLTHASSGTSRPSDEPLRFVYAGGLDVRSRNPEYALRALAQVRASVPLSADFYSYGNCEHVLRQSEFRSFVRAHGRVSPDDALAAMASADVHITQANRSELLTPSKIFDCMSTGLPIVHFYHRDSDPYLEYLGRYGLGLAVRIGTLADVASAQIVDFLDQVRGTRKSYAEVAAEFPECTPEQFATLLRQVSSDALAH